MSERILRIAPSKGWRAIPFKELWEFRDLFWILILRDIQLRYKQTFLGVAWVLLQPLTTILLLTFIFGKLAHLPSDGIPYILFAFAGMLPWNLFAQSLQRASTSLLVHSNLISKVYCPRIIIPLASVFSALLDFLVSLLVMMALMMFYKIAPTWNLLYLPVFLAMTLLFSIGIGLWFSALNVYYRDFIYVLPFFIQIWMYASPLVYSTKLIPQQYRALYFLNPMAGIIDGFRWSLFGSNAFPWFSIGSAVLTEGLILLGGAFFFQRIERYFADRI